MRFESDPLKAERNFKKHGVDFTEAASWWSCTPSGAARFD
jgi:uncharacterized DUF497 family protein